MPGQWPLPDFKVIVCNSEELLCNTYVVVSRQLNYVITVYAIQGQLLIGYLWLSLIINVYIIKDFITSDFVVFHLKQTCDFSAYSVEDSISPVKYEIVVISIQINKKAALRCLSKKETSYILAPTIFSKLTTPRFFQISDI